GGLIVRDELRLRVPSRGKPQTRLQSLQTLFVTVIPPKRVAQQSSEHRTRGEAPDGVKMVDFHAAEAHEGRIESEHQALHYAVLRRKTASRADPTAASSDCVASGADTFIVVASWRSTLPPYISSSFFM